MDGLSQKLQRIYRTYGIATSFKPHSTLRKQLVSPKDLNPADKKSGVVYEIRCTSCPDIYIGHTGRQLGERWKEHKSLSPSCKLLLLQNISSPPAILLIGRISKFWTEKIGSIPPPPARCRRPFTSKRRNLHWTVTKDWSYHPYIMDSSDWRHQGH